MVNGENGKSKEIVQRPVAKETNFLSAVVTLPNRLIMEIIVEGNL